MNMGKGNRRDFFRRIKPQAPVPDLELLRVGRGAMGGVFEILFKSEKRARIEIPHRALDEVRRLESLMTIFDESSRLSQINRMAARQAVEAEPELVELFKLSLELWNQTGGAFDIAAGALWRCWGFHQKRGELPEPEQLEEARAASGSRHLLLDESGACLRLGREGVEVNLGSIGKGFALDRAVAMLQNHDFGGALLHAGHSSFYGLGDSGLPQSGWRVSIRHPLRMDSSFATLRLRDLGMATSANSEQYFEVNGRRYGHIIDPRSGWPAECNLSSTALAPTAAVADALSTAFFVMSLSEVEAYCEKHPDVGGIIVPAKAGAESLEMHCFGIAGAYIEN